MTFKKYLNEEWVFDIGDTKIFVDPTPDELYNEVRENDAKDIRGVWDGDNLYVCSAYKVLHSQLENGVNKIRKSNDKKATYDFIKYVAFYHTKDNRVVTYPEYPTDLDNKPIFSNQEIKKADAQFYKLTNSMFKRIFPSLK